MSDWLALTQAAFGAAQGILGESYAYTPTSGTPFSAVGLFDESPQLVDVADVEMVGVLPILDVRVADHAERPKQGHRVRVRGKDYKVRRVEPAGPPSLRLTLDPVAAPGVFGTAAGAVSPVIGEAEGSA